MSAVLALLLAPSRDLGSDGGGYLVGEDNGPGGHVQYAVSVATDHPAKAPLLR